MATELKPLSKADYAKVKKRLEGRPTKYTPDIGQKIVAEMERGFSLAAAAAAFDIGRSTVYDWKDRNPDFAEMIDIAMVKRQRFHENRLYETTLGPVVTSAVFTLKNAGAADWREKQEVEHSGKVEYTEIKRVVIDPAEDKK